METTISLNELFKKIFKKWPALVALALAGAVVCNVYGCRKAESAADSALASHEAYAAAAAELPAYYTEEMYKLRSSMPEAEAIFCEAYADIYRNYINDYLDGSIAKDMQMLETYMMFMDSYKDVLSCMSGTQRSYYNALIYAHSDGSVSDADAEKLGAAVEPYEPAQVSALQPKWALIGAVAGALAGMLIVGLPCLVKAGKEDI